MTIVDTKDIGWHLLASELRAKAMSSAIEVDILNSSIEQSILKDWSSVISMECEEPPRVIRVENKGGFDSSNQNVNGWLSLVREKLYANPSVEDIFVDIEDDDVDVWVVIPEHDLAILHQIVEAEGELFDTLVSGESPPFLIEFHVIYRCGRNVEELAPTRAIRLPR